MKNKVSVIILAIIILIIAILSIVTLNFDVILQTSEKHKKRKYQKE